MTDGSQIIPPPTPMKITQIAVVVRDIEAALKTYTETLDCVLESGSGRGIDLNPTGVYP
jgi:catechol 2,3-dioxygenase-like lactoylglutathione lyase family enzyme